MTADVPSKLRRDRRWTFFIVALLCAASPSLGESYVWALTLPTSIGIVLLIDLQCQSYILRISVHNCGGRIPVMSKAAFREECDRQMR